MKLGQYSFNKIDSPEGETRTCKGCNIEKSIYEFSIDNHLKTTNRRGKCKHCVNQYHRERHSKNREKVLARRKELRDKNPEKHREYHKNYREENYEKSKKYQREYVRANRNMHNEYRRKRKETDLNYKVRICISGQIRDALKKRKINKNGESVFKFLPYSLEALVKHIESQFEPWMSWDKWGLYNSEIWDDNDSSTWTFHIDHIIPQSEFNYTSTQDEEFKKCWALENLRPYSSKQNLLDGLFRTRHNKNNRV